jgi:signal transduction histidine kinase
MEADSDHRHLLPPPLLFVGGVAFVLALALAIFFGVLQPPMRDLVALAGILSVAAAVSIALGYGAFHLGWVDRSPTLRWMLLGGYALSILLAFLSVWTTALLMFVNQHDLALATVLLLFAGGIALSLGYLLSSFLTGRIIELNEAAQEIALGNLDVRVPVTGRDELAELADAFNTMAVQLEAAEEQQKELELLRRELITWVGHDLRTPLTSIRVVVEALADGVVDDPADVERYLQTAQHHIHSLSQLLDDLFDVAQIDAEGMKLEPCNASIRDLISDTLESFSALAVRKGVELKGSTEPGVEPVPMDVPKIERVLSNLVQNAIRHTPAGGVVHVSGSATAIGVRVQVRDTGEGIPTEILPHVFEGLRTAEGDRRRGADGSGLGLTIAKGIVEAHGGDIGVESTVGEGTYVWFTLPHEVPTGSGHASPGNC